MQSNLQLGYDEGATAFVAVPNGSERGIRTPDRAVNSRLLYR